MQEGRSSSAPNKDIKLHNTTMRHADITFQLLQQITANFSEERKLGQGTFGTVYKGVHNGEEIAVKMFRDKDPGLDDARFHDEFDKLKSLSHPNIVQLIGYCYETHREYIEHEGVLVHAEKIYRALCLEYLHKGSLQNHLSDECHGLDWHTRYNIIKGSCEGLKYLHMGLKNPIHHLDLKPDNILLDGNMVPKLADFGLSKILEQTRSTEHVHGTLGYMPPEYWGNRIRSTKFDIFSLGVVIMEIIAGPTARTRIDDMPPQEFTGLLQTNWRMRLQKAWSGSSLEAYCRQVNTCIDIAFKCMEFNKDKRPHIANIDRQLDEIENEIGKSVLLSVQSVELQFHSDPSDLTISSLLRLTNNTAARVAFRLLTMNSEYLLRPLGGMVPPMSSCVLAVTTLSDQKPLQNSDGCCFTLESVIAVDQGVQDASRDAADNYSRFFAEAQKDGRVAQQVKLTASYIAPPVAGNTTTTETSGVYHEDITLFTMHDLVHDFAVLKLDDKFLDASKQGSFRGGSCLFALLTDCSKSLVLSLTCPDSLRALRFLDCSKIELCGDAFSSAASLCILDLSECHINQLPDSIGHLQHLKYLNAPGIHDKSIPNCITRLKKLNYLSIRGSSEILELPESIGEMEELVHLDLSGCSKIKELPELFGNLKNMEHLNLSKCSDVRGVSEQLVSLKKLEYLDVSYCKNIGNLPREFSSLTELEYLNLSFSSYLMGIEDSLLWDEELYKYPADNISNPAGPGIDGIVEAEILGTLTKVKYLKLCIDGFTTSLLPKVPESLGSFSQLKCLDLSGSSTLYKLPASFGKLHDLLHLDLSHCFRVEGVPEALIGLSKLKYLNLSGCSAGVNEQEQQPSLRGLQEAIGNLTELRYLNLHRCLKTMYGDQHVDESNAFLGQISTLSSLEHLILSQNENLYGLPESFGKLRKLRTLNLSYCGNLRMLPVSISEIGSLKFLNTSHCHRFDETTLPQFRNNSVLLPHFMVLADDSQSSSNLIKLKDENPAILEISRLERVKSAAEAQSIKLSGKQRIEEIKFKWTKDGERFVEDIEILQELMPPACSEYLVLQGYNSIFFPPWVTSIASYLPRLVSVSIMELPSCKSLPPLGQLGNLQELHIEQMDSISKIGADFYGCAAGAFPKLRTFRLFRMESLEEWNTEYTCGGEGGSHVLVFPILTLLDVRDSPKLRIKPCLPRGEYFLDIRSCDKVLYYSPLEERCNIIPEELSYPAPKGLFMYCSEQPLHEWSLLHQHNGFKYLGIEQCSDLTCSSAEIIRGLSSLETLSLRDSSSITAVPDWLGDLSSLIRLEIVNCSGIQTLPGSLQQLTNLEELTVSGCPDLVRWCKSESSTTLAHIKFKEFDN
ncbi:uncharacterized protein [Miscanthus floridulus]|uniref:uncharacterized protein isoform X5 n=1 Tax=Miscanthus floridulus TaxID=154761 RepID=UPI00345981E0